MTSYIGQPMVAVRDRKGGYLGLIHAVAELAGLWHNGQCHSARVD